MQITEHLGYGHTISAGRDSGNSRNGTRTKTVLSEIRPVEIEVTEPLTQCVGTDYRRSANPVH
ncbi:hypothetical protein [Rhodococcus jostii]|uniref:hypothetical protein n=1 Tax=Rhodococcus jostii TaxID=132919 RepID=UPI0009348A48|nr:hypothetical protein [Rhodococcus jostii]